MHYTEGSLNSKICIIGEAPGESEEMHPQKLPFVGAAGALLDSCLRSAGIGRHDCYITNTIKERPERNDISPFFVSSGRNVGFTERGLKHLKVLKEELAECKANVFVPLGAVALYALCGLTGIMKWRGSILESTLLPGRKVIPTIHPAAALREYLYKYMIVYDLTVVKEEAEFPEITLPQRNIIIEPSFEQCVSFLRDIIDNKRTVAFDIEVVNEQLSCISFATSSKEAISIPMTCWEEYEEKALMLLIAEVLEDEKITKIAQNCIFDMSFLAQKCGIVTKGEVHDTMILHHAAFPDLPKGLDFLTSVYTREPYYKDDGKLWKLGEYDNRKFWIYNAKDSLVTYECFENIYKKVYSKFQWNYEFTRSLIRPLIYMQLRGIRVNVEELEKTRESIKRLIDEKQKELNSVTGIDFNVFSHKTCREYFYYKLGYTPYVGRDNRSVTTDDKAMARLARKGCKEAAMVQEIRGLRKLLSTYLDMKLDSDNRLRCSYNPCGTTTGRLSSSKTIFGTGANFQNIPPEFRKFLEADPGHILIEMDKRQAEWVIVAYLTKDVRMIDIVESGKDAHTTTATLMFGIPEELVVKEDKIVGKTTDEVLIKQLRSKHVPEILKYPNLVSSMSIRQAAKKSNHSMNYGLSPQGFSITYTVPFADAKRCFALYHKAYPGLHTWHEQIRRQIDYDRTITNCFGRVRVFLGRKGDELYRAAFSFLPQSTVADMVNTGIMRIYNDQEGVMKKIDLIGQIHDSILFQYPIDDIKSLSEAVLKAKKYLEPVLSYGGREFIVKTDMKMGFSWGDYNEEEKRGMLPVKFFDNIDDQCEAVLSCIKKLSS